MTMAEKGSLPLSNSKHRRRRTTARNGFAASTALLFLGIACFWPFFFMLLFSLSKTTTRDLNSEVASPASLLRNEVRNVLDRVDVLGYGPTHPRVCAVITGDHATSEVDFAQSIESIFEYSDLSRLFLIAVVVDGQPENPELVKKLQKIHSGRIKHWRENEKEGQSEEVENTKVHVLFNPVAQGVTASRNDGANFCHMLDLHHQEAGLKSAHEDLILLLLQAGARLNSSWLPRVTQALIVPPPILEEHDNRVSLKLANAIAFEDGPTGWGPKLTPIPSEKPDAEELNSNNGASFSTPAWMGSAVAMRLETYLTLPSKDVGLRQAWPANLDLALNLWLCADGIDVLTGLSVTPPPVTTPDIPLSPMEAARLAAVWMDPSTSEDFFRTVKKASDWATTFTDWETWQSAARHDSGFSQLSSKCRSLEWYISHVNPALSAVLDDIGDDDDSVGEDTEDGKQQGHSKKDEVVDTGTTEEVQKDQPSKVVVQKEKPKPPDVKDEPVKVITRKEVETKGKKEEKADQSSSEEQFKIPDRPELKKPSKPLCPECLEIIQKAKPVDITYVDVSGGHKEHPHLGAKGPDDELGYVHNATSLHLNPEKFAWPEENLKAACAKRDNNYKMLQHVKVDFEGAKAAQESGRKRDKIFCLVYTAWKDDAPPEKHMHHERIPAIRQTWGQQCDGFMVGSTKTDPVLGTVNIVHEGEEAYNNIWQKVRSMWSYVYDHYYEDFDWFHIGGDDMYLLIDNMRLYLESEEIKTASNGGIYLPDGTETMQTPLFMGRRFAYLGDMNDIFISGGSGYTMNKAALKTLVVEGFPAVFPHAHTFSEDTMVAKIFRKFGVFPYSTQDDKGGERYMPFMPGHHYGYRMPADKKKDWYADYSINIKEGVDHCAEHSLAFHYVRDSDMYRLHAMFNGMCKTEESR